MRTLSTHSRAGMTLVELLVVVAILGVLAVTVLPGISNTTEGRRTRETARMITSFIAQAQAKALGQQTPSGFGLVNTGSNGPSLDLVPARVPDVYRGDTPNAVASGIISGGTMGLRFTGTNGLVSCTSGDLIRFGGGGPWFLMTSGTTCTMRSGSNTTVDSLAGQTPLNTAWPAPAPVTHPFEVLRAPQRSGAARSLGEGRCVDTYWSSLGRSGAAYVGSTPGVDVFYVLFDAAGAVQQVVAGPNRFAPDGPILLLVGRVDRTGDPPDPQEPFQLPVVNAPDDSTGFNWQYADSMWIAIDRLSGICTTAACDAALANANPVPSEVSDELAWRLRQSQTTIRSAVLSANR